MRVLSDSEVHDWLAAFPHRTEEDVQFDARGLFFSGPETSCIDLEYPIKLEQLPFFARYLATIGYENHDFQGALVWFTDWGVWNLAEESVGYRLVEAVHTAAGQPKAFEAAPGHRFRADELNETVGMLLLPMIFCWDAVYLPSWSYGTEQFFLHVSHDSYVTVVTRTKDFYERIFSLLEELDMQPKSGHELSVKRFCRIS
ncbi:MAG: hypothetical protein ACRD28_06835 [Acidobacteriaceae bacterium]